MAISQYVQRVRRTGGPHPHRPASASAMEGPAQGSASAARRTRQVCPRGPAPSRPDGGREGRGGACTTPLRRHPYPTPSHPTPFVQHGGVSTTPHPAPLPGCRPPRAGVNEAPPSAAPAPPPSVRDAPRQPTSGLPVLHTHMRTRRGGSPGSRSPRVTQIPEIW